MKNVHDSEKNDKQIADEDDDIANTEDCEEREDKKKSKKRKLKI